MKYQRRFERSPREFVNDTMNDARLEMEASEDRDVMRYVKAAHLQIHMGQVRNRRSIVDLQSRVEKLELHIKIAIVAFGVCLFIAFLALMFATNGA